jgi:two-component system LytT family response regulator
MSLKCIVIDDQQYAIDAMARYINDMPNMKVAKTFNKPLDALASITSEDAIDFIFLDIEMPGISGLELAKSLRERTRFLVFTTSHDKHALAAFQLQANQYLLKPISFAKFALTVNSILKNVDLAPTTANLPTDQFQFIKAEYKNSYHYINPADILYVQAAKNYVIINTDHEQFVTHLGISSIENALAPRDFIRISKSYIIAKRAIRKIEGNSIKLKNSEIFQIGRTYKPTFVSFMKENMIF